MLRSFKGTANIAELVLTFLISGFLLKFILRVVPVGCIMVVPTRISVFDIVIISFLNVFSILVFLYFLFNKIQDERHKRLFLNQRLVNLIMALLGLYYLINWFEKFCINYRIWVTIHSFIALPCFLALPLIYLIVKNIKETKLHEIFRFQTLKTFSAKLWKTFSYIAYEILLVIVVLLFYSTLPIIYPNTGYGCGLGLVSNVHFSTILFLILIALVSIISFIRPIIMKKKAILEILPTSILRLILIGLSWVGTEYFISYQRGNCIFLVQEVWNIIISITWLLGMSLILFFVIYLLIRGREYLQKSEK